PRHTEVDGRPRRGRARRDSEQLGGPDAQEAHGGVGQHRARPREEEEERRHPAAQPLVRLLPELPMCLRAYASDERIRRQPGWQAAKLETERVQLVVETLAVAHRILLRSAASARCTRDFTVETGADRTSAISSNVISSSNRRTSASR